MDMGVSDGGFILITASLMKRAVLFPLARSVALVTPVARIHGGRLSTQ
jgi:hypothetical protein